jgi:NTE family protein
MGALVGAAFAGGKLDALEDWARALTPRRVWSLIDMRLTGGGLVGGTSIRRMLAEIGLDRQIEDLDMPFTAVAADLSSGREIWLQEGPLVTATRASVAIPGVLSPVCIDGRWLIDGGVVNPVPITPLVAAGAQVVIAVNPNAATAGQFWTPGEDSPGLPDFSDIVEQVSDKLPEPLSRIWQSSPQADGAKDPAPPSYTALINATIDMMSDQIRRARLAADAPHVLISARLGDMNIMQFHRASEAIAEGYRVTMAQADWIETLLSAH